MNKGFKYYYKGSLKKARKEFKKKKNIGKFYAYLFSSLIGRLILFLFMPSFSLADYKLAKMVKDEEDISLSKVYEAMDTPKTVWTCILTAINELLIFLGGIIIILIPTAVLMGIGLACIYIFQVTDAYSQIYILGGFAVPGAIAMVVYMILFPFYLAPVYYLISCVDHDHASEVLKNSFKAMRRGKWTYFALLFVSSLMLTLILAVFAAAGAGLIYVLPTYLINSGILNSTGFLYYTIVGLGGIASIALLLWYMQIFANRFVGCQIATMSLFDDLLIYKDTIVDEIEGIKLKKHSVKRPSVMNYKDNLIRLFDETTEYSEYEESYSPVQESSESLGHEPIVDEYLASKNKPQEEEIIEEHAPIPEAPQEETPVEEEKPEEAPVEVPEDTEMEVKSERVLSKADLKKQMKLAKKQEKEAKKQAKKEEAEAKKAAKKNKKADEAPVEEPQEELPAENNEVIREEATENTEVPVTENTEAPVEESTIEPSEETAPDAEPEPSEAMEAEPAEEDDDLAQEDSFFNEESADESSEFSAEPEEAPAEPEAEEPSEPVAEPSDVDFNTEEPKNESDGDDSDNDESNPETEDIKFDDTEDDIAFNDDSSNEENE